MDLGIRGRVAVVAASTGGLGRAVAEALAAEGAGAASWPSAPAGSPNRCPGWPCPTPDGPPSPRT